MSYMPNIYMAHSVTKYGVTVYSYEEWLDNGNFYANPVKAGCHRCTADTLEPAKAAILDWIKLDWSRANRPVPSIKYCGKVSDLKGRTFSFK